MDETFYGNCGDISEFQAHLVGLNYPMFHLHPSDLFRLPTKNLPSDLRLVKKKIWRSTTRGEILVVNGKKKLQIFTNVVVEKNAVSHLRTKSVTILHLTLIFQSQNRKSWNLRRVCRNFGPRRTCIIFKWIFYLSLNDEFDIKKKTMERNCESILSVY